MVSKYDMKGHDQCRVHQSLLQFYCEDDSVICCAQCVIKSHRQCQHITEMEQVAKKRFLDFAYMQTEILKLETKVDKFKQKLEEVKDNFKTDIFQVTDQVQSMQDKVNAVFEMFKEYVLKEGATFQQQVFQDIDRKITSCERCIADAKQITSDIRAVSEQGSPGQQLIINENLKLHFENLRSKTEMVCNKLDHIIITFEFDDSLKLPPSCNIMPGKFKMQHVALNNVDDSQDQDQRVNLKLLTSKQLTKDDSCSNEPLLSGLDFLPDGRLVAVDNMNKTCLVFNHNLEKVRSFTLPFKPMSVAVMSKNKVAITSGKALKIYFLRIDDKSEITFASECAVSNKYDSISLMNRNNFLVGSYDSTQPCLVLSTTGDEKEFGINFPPNTYPIDYTKCAFIRNKYKVVLSDRYACSLYIYDILKNNRVVVSDSKTFNEPCGIAIGPNDNIFVCVEQAQIIVQISSSGQILTSHKLDMKYPKSISISKDNRKLAVSNSYSEKKMIQMFELINE